MTTRPISLTDWQVRAALDGRLSLVVEPVIPPSPYDPGDDFDAVLAMGFVKISRAAGDRLWAREAHYLTDDGDSEYAVFAEDDDAVAEHLQDMQTVMAGHPDIDWSKHLRLRPSTHMPRWTSRLTLIVTDVTVMRVREIEWRHVSASGLDVYCEKFSDFWNARHAERGLGWDTNPWVTATTFTVHRCNIDQMEANHE